MDYTTTQVIAAILMVIIAIGLILTWRRYQATNAERRRMAMLASLGLDPALVSTGDMPTIMRDVRNRCERCQSEDVCERWLRGEETGGNEFCPNAKVFDILQKYGPTAG
jgi:hypothetical protein